MKILEIKYTDDGLLTLEKNNNDFIIFLNWESSGEQEALETFDNIDDAKNAWLKAK